MNNNQEPKVKSHIDLEDYKGNVVRSTGSKSKTKFNKTNDSIQWALWTWNPVTGCLHGCKYCYAREIAENSQFKGVFPAGFKPLFRHDRLDAPKNTKVKVDLEKPESKRVFVCSMADLFGKWVPSEWINKIIYATKQAPELEYLFLTKNPSRYLKIDMPDNFWLGATVDTQVRVEKTIEIMRSVKSGGIKWISFEPLLEPIMADFTGIDWIVIGAQSGTRQPDGTKIDAFSPKFEWVMDLVIQAGKAGCAVYMKQNLLGKVSEQYPGVELIQEDPKMTRLRDCSVSM